MLGSPTTNRLEGGTVGARAEPDVDSAPKRFETELAPVAIPPVVHPRAIDDRLWLLPRFARRIIWWKSQSGCHQWTCANTASIRREAVRPGRPCRGTASIWPVRTAGDDATRGPALADRSGSRCAARPRSRRRRVGHRPWSGPLPSRVILLAYGDSAWSALIADSRASSSRASNFAPRRRRSTHRLAPA